MIVQTIRHNVALSTDSKILESEEGVRIKKPSIHVIFKTKYNKCSGRDGRIRRLYQTKRKEAAKRKSLEQALACMSFFDEEPEPDENPFVDYIA